MHCKSFSVFLPRFSMLIRCTYQIVLKMSSDPLRRGNLSWPTFHSLINNHPRTTQIQGFQRCLCPAVPPDITIQAIAEVTNDQAGTFSGQLNVQQLYKASDMILRTNIAWEAGGGLAFMSARREVSVTKINNRPPKCTDIAMRIETEVAQRRPNVTCIPELWNLCT
jgi:hypothetical protein